MSVTSRRPSVPHQGLSLEAFGSNGISRHSRSSSSISVPATPTARRSRIPSTINTKVNGAISIAANEQTRPESPLDRPRGSPLPHNMMRRNSLGRYHAGHTASFGIPSSLPRRDTSPAYNIFSTGYESNDGVSGEGQFPSDARSSIDAHQAQQLKAQRAEIRRYKRQVDEMQKALSKVESELAAIQKSHSELEKKATQLARRRDRDIKAYQKHLADIEKRSGQEIDERKSEINALRERLQNKDAELAAMSKSLREKHQEEATVLKKELEATKQKHDQKAHLATTLEMELKDAVQRILELEDSKECEMQARNSLAGLRSKCVSQQRLITQLQIEAEEARYRLASKSSFVWDSIERKPSHVTLGPKLSQIGMRGAPSSAESMSSSLFDSENANKRSFNKKSHRVLHHRSKSEIIVTLADILEADEMPSNGSSVVGKCNLRPIPSVSDYGSQRLGYKNSKSVLGALSDISFERNVDNVNTNAISSPRNVKTGLQPLVPMFDEAHDVDMQTRNSHRRSFSMPLLSQYAPALHSEAIVLQQPGANSSIQPVGYLDTAGVDSSPVLPASYPLSDTLCTESTPLIDQNNTQELTSPNSTNKKAVTVDPIILCCTFLVFLIIYTYILLWAPSLGSWRISNALTDAH